MGCWESCNPKHKSLSSANGVNLIEEARSNWIDRTFGKVKIHAKLVFEIYKGDDKMRIKNFADEVIFCEPGVKLSEEISKFISTAKYIKSEEYDKLCREWTLDPSKTTIVVSLTNNDAQFAENKYKSLSQLKLNVDVGVNYFVQITAWCYKISPESEFTTIRRSLVTNTLSNEGSNLKTDITESPRGSLIYAKFDFEGRKVKKRENRVKEIPKRL